MIYLATPEGVPDLVKIGFTAASGVKRISELQTGSPVPLSLAAEWEGGIARENMLHAIFREHRAHGEWFRVSPQEVKSVNDAINPARMAALLKLKPFEFARVSQTVGAATIKETFTAAMAASGFDKIISDAKRRPIASSSAEAHELYRVGMAAKKLKINRTTLIAGIERLEVPTYETACGLPLVYLPDVRKWAKVTRKRGRKPKDQ